MSEKNILNDSSSLKKIFQNDKNFTSPYIYLPIDSKDNLDSTLTISKLVSGYKKSGYGGVIPFSNKNYGIRPLTEQYYKFYSDVKNETVSNMLKLGYVDDTYIMREYLNKISVGTLVYSVFASNVNS